MIELQYIFGESSRNLCGVHFHDIGGIFTGRIAESSYGYN